MAENQHTTSPELVAYDESLEIWDRSDPMALINLLPKEVGYKMEETFQKTPKYFQLDEQELSVALKKDARMINATDNRIRLKFWMEYDLCKERGLRSMVMARVIGGICTREFFYKYYLREPSRVAWLLCPPVNYMVKANEALEFGLEQLRDILAVPHVDRAGRIDRGAAALKVAIFKMLEDRVKGAVIQRTASVSVNISPQDKKLLIEQAQSMTDFDVKQRIVELEKRDRQATHLPDHSDEEPIRDAAPVQDD